jgi:hypothetical protein
MPKRRSEQPRHRGRRDSDLRRQRPTREARTLILIVCEGEKTEFRYFEAMRQSKGLRTVAIEVTGAGRQCEQLIEHAVKLRRQRQKDANTLPYDEVWCVFDREAANEPEHFRRSIERAGRESINVAVSNPSFEYWYLLHYRETNQPFHNADDVCRALRHHECMPGYQKNQEVFERLDSYMNVALERAARLYEGHPDCEHDRFPNPSTLVYQLIRRLIEQ